MTTPPATIIIPCYNAERWVGRAIESLLNQSIANLQVVIVDDGSTDASFGVIRQYAGVVDLSQDFLDLRECERSNDYLR